ncbi:MAG: MYXO-CTERM sorting domain-containing protein [Myxococcaceae bacterium]
MSTRDVTSMLLGLLRILVTTTLLLSAVARAEGLVVWEYADPFDAVTRAEQLPNGNFLMANANAFYELVPNPGSGGTQINRLDDNWHTATRLTNGNTLAANIFPDQRVQEVSPIGTIVWQWGGGVPACSNTTAGFASNAIPLSNGDVLVADSGEHRVMRITPAGTKSWQFGRSDCLTDTVPNGGIFKPSGLAQHPMNGNLVISEHRMVFEIVPAGAAGGTIVRWYGDGVNADAQPGHVENAADVAVLSNGNWLISDSKNYRIIEVVPFDSVTTGAIVWQYGVTDVPGTTPGHLASPGSVRPLANGNILVVDGVQAKVLEISRAFLDFPSPPTLEVGQCVGPFALQIRDSGGTARVANFAVDVSLSSSDSNLALYSDSGCQTALIAPVSIPAGVGNANVYLRAAAAGTYRIDAGALGYETDAQTIFAAISSPPDGGAGPPPPLPNGPSSATSPWDLNVGCACTSAPPSALALWAGALLILSLRQRRKR